MLCLGSSAEGACPTAEGDFSMPGWRPLTKPIAPWALSADFTPLKTKQRRSSLALRPEPSFAEKKRSPLLLKLAVNAPDLVCGVAPVSFPACRLRFPRQRLDNYGAI